jgi:hypothetical protein
LSLREEKVQYQNKEIRLSILELENAVLVFFTEGSLKLGTVAVSMATGDVVTSSVLLGGKYLLCSRAIAERAVAMYKKMGLASVHTQIPEAEVVRLANTLLTKIKEKS